MLLAVGWLPMILMSASILRSYRDRAISVRSTEVQNQCKILSNQLLSYNYMEDPSTELIDGELAQLASLYDGRIIHSAGKELALKLEEQGYDWLINQYK